MLELAGEARHRGGTPRAGAQAGWDGTGQALARGYGKWGLHNDTTRHVP